MTARTGARFLQTEVASARDSSARAEVAGANMAEAREAGPSSPPISGMASPSLALNGNPRRPSAASRIASGSGAAGRLDPIALRCKAVTSVKRDPQATVEALSELVRLYRASGAPSEQPPKIHRQVSEAPSAADQPTGPVLLQRDSKGKGVAREPEQLDVVAFRKDIEQTLNSSRGQATRAYLSGLKGLVDALDTLDDELETVRVSCEESLKKYSTARQASRHLLSATESLQADRAALESQLALSSLFLARFALSPQEEALVRSKELDTVGDELFAVIDRLAQIRKDAEVLLGGTIADDAPPASAASAGPGSAALAGGIRAGVDVMDTTAAQLDAVYSKIARWLSFQFRQPVQEGAEVSPRMRQAVRRLMLGGRTDDLLKPALATLSSSRAAYLSTAFQMALTVGGAPGRRPIELHAHDSLRYAGDMLAWVHQALASEREFLAALFSEHEGGDGRRIGQRRRGLEGSLDVRPSLVEDLVRETRDGTLALSQAERSVREMLDLNLAGTARPLRTRLVQTVRSQEGCITSFRLANLIDFYRLTITRTLGSKATLSRTLHDLTTVAYDAFGVTLHNLASGLARYSDAPDSATLEVPAPLMGAGATLKELLAVVQSALADEPAADASGGLLDKEAREQASRQLQLILTELVGAMVALTERLAKLLVEQRPRGKSEADARWEQRIFHANCLEHILGILQPHEQAREKAQQLTAQRDEQLAQLAEAHSERLLAESKLAPLLAAMSKSEQSGAVLSHQPEATPEAVASTLAAFNEFLASPSIVSSPRLAKLEAPALRASVHQTALRSLADAYARVVHAVMNPANRYEWKETLIKRSEAEVRLLLGVQADS